MNIKESAKSFASSALPRSRWVLPVVLGLAVIAMMMFVNRPRTSSPVRPPDETPDVTTRLGTEFNQAAGSLTGTLSGITDEATAEAAVPRLEDAKGKLAEIRATAAQLSQEGRAKFDELVQTQRGALEEQSRRVAAIPGAGDKIKPVLDDLMSRVLVPVGGAPSEDVR